MNSDQKRKVWQINNKLINVELESERIETPMENSINLVNDDDSMVTTDENSCQINGNSNKKSIETDNYLNINVLSAIPETKTYEDILAFSHQSSRHLWTLKRQDTLNLRDKRTTKVVIFVGTLLLVMSLVLIAVSLSLSEHIDRMVKENHMKRHPTKLSSILNNSIQTSSTSDNNSTMPENVF